MSRYLCTASRLCTRSKVVWRQGTAQMWNECWGGLWILWWEPICEQKYKSEWMLKVLTKHNLPPTSWSCIPVLHNSRLLSHQLFFVHQPSQVPQSTIHYSSNDVTDHGEESGGNPDNEAHVDAAGALQNSRWRDKDATADDASNNYLDNHDQDDNDGEVTHIDDDDDDYSASIEKGHFCFETDALSLPTANFNFKFLICVAEIGVQYIIQRQELEWCTIYALGVKMLGNVKFKPWCKT